MVCGRVWVWDLPRPSPCVMVLALGCVLEVAFLAAEGPGVGGRKDLFWDLFLHGTLWGFHLWVGKGMAASVLNRG